MEILFVAVQLGGNTEVEWLGLDLYKSPPPCSARSLRTRPSYMPIVCLCQVLFETADKVMPDRHAEILPNVSY
jgi:hypothetical protein